MILWKASGRYCCFITTVMVVKIYDLIKSKQACILKTPNDSEI